MYNHQLNVNGVYYCYLRKSRADVELERLKKLDTLKQHEKLVKERAKQLGIKIAKYYREVVSGETIQDRPEMQKLLKEIESEKIDGVLVVEVERLSRGDTKDQGTVAQTFKYTNTKIITLNKIYDPNSEEDEEYFEFGLFMSRREYKTINRRMQRGRLANVLEGKYVGSVPPLGYVKKRVEFGKGYTLQAKDDEATIVKEIFKMRKNGQGEQIITNWLNTLDIKPRRSDCWTPATVSDILKNPIYLGKIRWNYNVTKKTISSGIITKKRRKGTEDEIIMVEGLHEPIIDEETFNIVQNIKKEKEPCTRKSFETQNPLAGLVKCSICGRNMQRRPYYHPKNSGTKLTRKYFLDRDKLRQCLIEHKAKSFLSNRDIALALNVSRNLTPHWFTNNIKRFTIPNKDIWFELKKLLNIETNEFDKKITEFEEVTPIPHEDTLLCPKTHCENIGSDLSLVEEIIISELKKYLEEKERYYFDYNPNEQNTDNTNNVLQSELSRLNKQLNKAYELVEQGIYTSLEFSQRTLIIKNKIKNIEKELEENKNDNKKEKLKEEIPIIKNLIDEYQSIENANEKNKLLRQIISHVDYKKTKGGRWKESDLSIVIHPII